jgi:2-dehydro-3-deoxygluconokinase
MTAETPRHDLTSVRPFDVLALGEALIEFNQTQADPPLYLQGFGGDTSNAIIAAARAGARTGYLTRLGDDGWADRLLQLWRAEGVSTGGVRRMPGQRTGLYFVHHDAQGHHFSYARAGSAASLMAVDDVRTHWADLLGLSQWLHVSGISLAISESAREATLLAMQVARQKGTRVALDTNLRLSLWSVEQARDTLIRAMAECDLLLPSLDDLVQLIGPGEPQAMASWCHAQGVRTVVLKLGNQGALISQDGAMTRVEGLRVEAVDATGAGDCFCGNLLARRVAGDDLAQAVRWANAAAALSVQGRGAIAPLPTASQVRLLLGNPP